MSIGWMIILSCIVVLPTATAQDVRSVSIADGLDRPIFAVSPPGDTRRLFIAEQHTGRIRILDLANVDASPTTFLDLSGLATGNEQGLLGLAFHPDYADNGLFYVNFSDSSGTTNIRSYRVSENNANRADVSSARTVLRINQPQTNHNGGWMGFGPNDGYLYIASGDGGGGNDSGGGHTSGTGNGQDITNNLLGKMLRIDVDGDSFPGDRNYAIPDDNPFVGVNGDDEIWAYGLRNPWRNSFDRATGDLIIGDVGQSAREEIDFQRADSAGGENYGWRLREGTIATPNVGGAPPPGAIDPVYDHTRGNGQFQGRAVTGGYVYRGPIESLQGQYFFGDFVTSKIWSIEIDRDSEQMVAGSLVDRTAEFGNISNIASFGEDGAGNLYVASFSGRIYKIVPDPFLESDLTGNGAVDFQDLTVLLASWNRPDATRLDGNLVEPETTSVDFADLTTLLAEWTGPIAAGAAANAQAVPEPSALLLAIVGMLALCGCRRRCVAKR
jgi:glucose/arabinose dehydrogenase